MSRHITLAALVHQRLDEDGSRPRLQRTHAEIEALRRREALRRQVGIQRLMQQGLTRFEAEEQWQWRVGRRLP